MEQTLSVFTIIISLGLLIIYFIPTVIAFKRTAASKWAIFLVNLFFGWTLLIWIVALIWACEGRK